MGTALCHPSNGCAYNDTGSPCCAPTDPRQMRAHSVLHSLPEPMGVAFCKPVDNRTQFVATLDRVSVPNSKMVDALIIIRERGLNDMRPKEGFSPKVQDQVAAVEIALRCLVDGAFSIETISTRPATDTYKVLLRAKMQEVTCSRLDKCRVACEKLRWSDLLFLGEGADALKEFLVAAFDAATIYEEVKMQLPRLGVTERYVN